MDDEPARLIALADAGIVGASPPLDLQSLVDLAATLFRAPAFLTLIDKDTLHAGISSVGPLPPMPRCDTVCDRVIRQSGAVIVEDLLTEPEFADGPVVRMGMRSYAGVPVHAPDRDGIARPLGALCVVDAVPRALDDDEAASLRRLGLLADALLAARSAANRATAEADRSRRLAADLGRRNQMLSQAERLTQIGSWRLSLPAGELHWSSGVWGIYALEPQPQPRLDAALAPYRGEARTRVEACLAHTEATGEPFDFEEDFVDAAGSLRRVRCMGEREEADGVVLGLVGVFQDITDRRQVEATLRRDATTDRLTGLANRQGFDLALAAAMARAAAGAPLAVAMIDLDGFKAINDRHGHAAGDDVLRAVGASLAAATPNGSTAARLGGDEFAVIIEDAGLCADPDAVASRFAQALRVPVAAEPGLHAEGSIGVAGYAAARGRSDLFLRMADMALYASKRQKSADWSRRSPSPNDRRRTVGAHDRDASARPSYATTTD